MAYFETSSIGLIIAALNVATFLVLVYLFLERVADERSALLRVLDRIFAPILKPHRRSLPVWRVDIAALILAVVLQMIVIAIKRWYR
jgi:uncharacterized protein YggT (Ycf19 family)